MATETRSSGTQADDSSIGTLTWSTPSNAAASDNVYSSVSGGPGATSHYHKSTNFGFTTIGDSDNLTQIKLRVERKKSSGGTIKDFHVYLVVGGTIQTGTDYADTSTAYPSSDTYAEYTITTGLPTVAQLKASGFGFVICCKDSSGFPWGVDIDHTEIVATYTVTNNITVTPSVLALVLATFAPTIRLPKIVLPSVRALTLTAYAPTAVIGGPKTVTPSTLALALSTFAPTVIATQNKRVIPGTAALVIAAFAPAILAPRVVRPSTVALALTTFGPNAKVQRKWQSQRLTLHDG